MKFGNLWGEKMLNEYTVLQLIVVEMPETREVE